ncbi:hypothetical protein [Croceimicrobium hydrocarbonivorans]|uniref:Uncharacterized protein n=1 Tax=Croceimicrobium hydrocarbonivorans TaxID=2761580 RepID=A0A7H0VBB3_9FLAO|nr:hypothetical protein [Croceimicrobium hydrocarbonivorans]QNR23011.1 hypothetical protein H4K34_11535 [Croceimicrobium hydrocarbonivorans]
MATAFDSANILIGKGGGFKAGTLYGESPSSGLGTLVDFDAVQNTSNASRVNSTGQIEFVPANTPRWCWAELGNCPSLLDEPDRTNFATDNSTPANWYNSTLTPAEPGAFELNNSFDWGLYTQNGTTNNLGFVYGGFSPGQNWAISLYVKISASGDYIGVRETGNGIGVVRISTETVTTAGGGISSVKVYDTVNDDIKRVVILGTTLGANNLFLQLPSSGAILELMTVIRCS